jgi:hypothetical protein
MLFTLAYVSGFAHALQESRTLDDPAPAPHVPALPPLKTLITHESTLDDVMKLPFVDHVFDVTVTVPASMSDVQSVIVRARMGFDQGKSPTFALTPNTPTRVVVRRPAGVALFLHVSELLGASGVISQSADGSSVLRPSKAIPARYPTEGTPLAVQLHVVQAQAYSIALAPMVPQLFGSSAYHPEEKAPRLPFVSVMNVDQGDYPPGLRDHTDPENWVLQCGGSEDCNFVIVPFPARPTTLVIGTSPPDGAYQSKLFACLPCPDPGQPCDFLGRFDIQPEQTVRNVKVRMQTSLANWLADETRQYMGSTGVSFVRMSDRKAFSGSQGIATDESPRLTSPVFTGGFPAGTFVVLPNGEISNAVSRNVIKAMENGIDVTTYGLPSVTITADTTMLELEYNLDDLYAAAKTVPQQK